MRPTRLHVQVNPASSLVEAFTEARLRAALPEAEAALSFGMAEPALEEGLATAEVLLLAGHAPLHDLPRRAPHLRWISYTSAGVEWLLKAGLPPQVALTNASGTHIPKAAEYALLAVLMLNNHIPFFATAARAGRWAPKPAGTVAGKTVLILGMGALGGAAAEVLARAGLRVIGNSHAGRPHPDVALMTRGDGFRAHLPETDVLIIALPLTPATEGLVGAAELDLLPRHAGVVNIGRGEILDAEALADRLEDGRLAGAVLDALPVEPLPPDHRLWTTPNLFITPHCGLYDPSEYGPRCLEAFRANLLRFRTGKPLHQLVEPGRGY
jgi:phosphoglycerate dehydrogenase-like enzyme